LGGPTLSKTIELNGVYITHHLLSITGEVTPQPVERDGKHFLLLGEIYNYDTSLPSDIYFGIEKYLEYGNSFTEHLDGEFLFIVSDGNTIDFFSDPWGTRQAYYYEVGDYFYFTTFANDESVLYTVGYSDQHYRFPDNAHCRFDLHKKSLYTINEELTKWNLDQNVNSLEDVNQAFEESVLKRWYPNCTLFLSSGLDSSAVALCLADNNKKFNALTNMFNPEFEDENTLSKVIEYCGEYINYHRIKGTNIDYRPRHSASSEIRRQAKERFNSKVVLMGTGGDGILDNCRSKNIDKNIIGDFDVWPEDQSTIFPWKGFYAHGTGTDHEIADDYHETYNLFYGLEKRGVYHDKRLAQAWLNVDANIKNREYKILTKEYLRDRNIPISKFPKSGFNKQTRAAPRADDSLRMNYNKSGRAGL
jgi:asparagine synthetase B (glutamine-hydrolysing)